MRQLLLYKWERDAPDAGPAHCSLPYICLCGASSVIYGFRRHICETTVLGSAQPERDQNKTPQSLSSRGALVEQSFPRKLLMISLTVCVVE